MISTEGGVVTLEGFTRGLLLGFRDKTHKKQMPWCFLCIFIDVFIFGGFEEDKIDFHAVKPHFLLDDKDVEASGTELLSGKASVFKK